MNRNMFYFIVSCHNYIEILTKCVFIVSITHTCLMYYFLTSVEETDCLWICINIKMFVRQYVSPLRTFVLAWDTLTKMHIMLSSSV